MKTLRTLIVEDDTDARELLVELVTALGHDAGAAANASAALAAVSAGTYDVALLDLGLPQVSGLELACQLRASGHSLELVALTGYNDDEIRQQARAAGFDAFLVKPIQERELADVLQRVAGDRGKATQP